MAKIFAGITDLPVGAFVPTEITPAGPPFPVGFSTARFVSGAVIALFAAIEVTCFVSLKISMES